MALTSSLVARTIAAYAQTLASGGLKNREP
jgi:hypothetical protein